MILLSGVTLLIVLFTWLQVRYNLLGWNPEGLRVLMYHRLDGSRNDFLTVSERIFDGHIRHLKKEGYRFISLKELSDAVSNNKSISGKSVLITFDDGYQDNYTFAKPILEKHGVKAALFLPVAFVGKTNEWDGGGAPLMDFETLKMVDCFEYGLHSYHHQNLAELSLSALEEDIKKCQSVLLQNNLPFVPCLAYPYGRYPKQQKMFDAFRLVLEENGIRFAFRIGNKINVAPFASRYLLKRIDIRGTDSFRDFCVKVAKGRTTLF